MISPSHLTGAAATAALQDLLAWQNAAYILTCDLHGGFFDHVAPPVLDASGAGICE